MIRNIKGMYLLYQRGCPQGRVSIPSSCTHGVASCQVLYPRHPLGNLDRPDTRLTLLAPADKKEEKTDNAKNACLLVAKMTTTDAVDLTLKV